jgi:hypothetical protein
MRVLKSTSRLLARQCPGIPVALATLLFTAAWAGAQVPTLADALSLLEQVKSLDAQGR